MFPKREVGSEKTFSNGYTYKKCSDGKWRLKQRIIIEKHLGIELPREVKIWFKDGNRNNFDIDNLLIFDRKNKMRIYFAQAKPIGEGLFSWSRRFKKCRECETTKTPHCGKGYCDNCYKSLHREGKL